MERHTVWVGGWEESRGLVWSALENIDKAYKTLFVESTHIRQAVLQDRSPISIGVNIWPRSRYQLTELFACYGRTYPIGQLSHPNLIPNFLALILDDSRPHSRYRRVHRPLV